MEADHFYAGIYKGTNRAMISVLLAAQNG